VSPIAIPWSESAPGLARLPTHASSASAPDALGDSHATTTELRPRTRRVYGDVGVRFGGSEHHRIGTSSSHPAPAFGLGPRLFRASPPRLFGAPTPCPGYAGTTRPEGADTRHRGGPPAFGPSDPPRRDRSVTALRSRRAARPPRFFGTPASVPGTRRRDSSEPRPPASPRAWDPGSSEPRLSPAPARQEPPTPLRGRPPTALRNGGAPTWHPVNPLGSSEPWRGPVGWTRTYAPRFGGGAVGEDRFRPATRRAGR
jgi:hypothetical protein